LGYGLLRFDQFIFWSDMVGQSFLPVVRIVLNFIHEPGRYILRPIFSLLPCPNGLYRNAQKPGEYRLTDMKDIFADLLRFQRIGETFFRPCF
jgi:hypothetical protein